jgi:hypothetical protein
MIIDWDWFGASERSAGIQRRAWLAAPFPDPRCLLPYSAWRVAQLWSRRYRQIGLEQSRIPQVGAVEMTRRSSPFLIVEENLADFHIVDEIFESWMMHLGLGPRMSRPCFLCISHTSMACLDSIRCLPTPGAE